LPRGGTTSPPPGVYSSGGRGRGRRLPVLRRGAIGSAGDGVLGGVLDDLGGELKAAIATGAAELEAEVLVGRLVLGQALFVPAGDGGVPGAIGDGDAVGFLVIEGEKDALSRGHGATNLSIAAWPG